MSHNNLRHPHTCAATGCVKMIEQRMLMCPHHFRLLPPEISRAVWATYHERGGLDGNPLHLGYQRACAEAVEHVARLEGQPEGNSYRRCVNLLEARAAGRSVKLAGVEAI